MHLQCENFPQKPKTKTNTSRRKFYSQCSQAYVNFLLAKNLLVHSAKQKVIRINLSLYTKNQRCKYKMEPKKCLLLPSPYWQEIWSYLLFVSRSAILKMRSVDHSGQTYLSRTAMYGTAKVSAGGPWTSFWPLHEPQSGGADGVLLFLSFLHSSGYCCGHQIQVFPISFLIPQIPHNINKHIFLRAVHDVQKTWQDAKLHKVDMLYLFYISSFWNCYKMKILGKHLCMLRQKSNFKICSKVCLFFFMCRFNESSKMLGLLFSVMIHRHISYSTESKNQEGNWASRKRKLFNKR